VLVGALVNGIKALMFGGIPVALVVGLVLDKFLGVGKFYLLYRYLSKNQWELLKKYGD
jgi:uncharacterized membrane-anchored protein